MKGGGGDARLLAAQVIWQRWRLRYDAKAAQHRFTPLEGPHCGRKVHVWRCQKRKERQGALWATQPRSLYLIAAEWRIVLTEKWPPSHQDLVCLILFVSRSSLSNMRS